MAQADRFCVEALNHILTETGALIVVSSTWRAHRYNGLSRIFESWKIDRPIFSLTPDLTRKHGVIYEGVQRGDEIQKWLDEHQDLTESFVILDDDTDMKHLLHRLVRTRSDIGLTTQDAHRAIALLNQY